MQKNNIIYLSFAEHETDKAKEIDSAANILTREVKAADRFAILIGEIPVYEVFTPLLGGMPENLASTKQLWQDTTYDKLLNSISTLQFFCTKYKNDYPILKKMLNQHSDPRVSKEKILKYFDHINKPLNECKIKFDEANSSLKKFTNSVENDKDKLFGTVLPKIRQEKKNKDDEFQKTLHDLYQVNSDITAADKIYDQFLYLTLGISAGIVLTPVVHFGLKGLGNLMVKSGSKIIKSIGGKLGGKLFGGVTIFVTVAEVASLIATSVKFEQYSRKCRELRERKFNYEKRKNELDTETTQLASLITEYQKVLEQASEVDDKFIGLKSAWYNSAMSLDKLKESAADMKTDIDSDDLEYIEGSLDTFEEQFKLLSDKLKKYELGFTMDVVINDRVIDLNDLKDIQDLENIEKNYSSQFFPRALYAAYNQLYI